MFSCGIKEEVVFYVEKRFFKIVLVVAQEEHRGNCGTIEDSPFFSIVLYSSLMLVNFTNVIPLYFTLVSSSSIESSSIYRLLDLIF
jgi:hypothetical protein